MSRRTTIFMAIVCTALSVVLSFATTTFAEAYDDADMAARSGKTTPTQAPAPEPYSDKSETPTSSSPKYVGTPEKGEFHIDIGISFVGGGDDVDGALDELYTANFLSGTGSTFNGGIRVDAYYEWANGFGVGGGIGPFFYRKIDNVPNGFTPSASGDNAFLIIPVGLDARYTFFRNSVVAPYLRGGFRYPIGVGDIVESGSIGPFGAVGIDFLRNKFMGFGIEAGYDGSEIDMKLGGDTRTVKPMQFMFSVFVEF